MTDHRILRRRRQEAQARIVAHVESIAEVVPTLADHAEEVTTVRGRDPYHEEAARAVALADFVEALDKHLRGEEAADRYENMRVADLKAELDERGIDYERDDRKPDLQERLRQADAEAEEGGDQAPEDADDGEDGEDGGQAPDGGQA